MAVCLLKNEPYEKNLKLSGVKEEDYRAFASRFVEERGRFPYTDEIPYANSLPALEEGIKLKNSAATNDDLLKYTGEADIESVAPAINNLHRDLRVRVYPLDKSSILNIKRRPSEWVSEETDPIKIDEAISEGQNANIWGEIATNLAKDYGIKINVTNNEEIANKFSDLIDTKTSNAFIYNGQIYLNSDNARVDAPVHEVMHLLMGSIKFTNPVLYNSLVSTAEQFPSFNNIASVYKNRTRSDLDEEVFISEFSKLVTGQESNISKLDTKVTQDIFYNIYRLLDNTVFGSRSVKSLNPEKVLNMSLVDLCKALNSDLVNNKFSGSLNLRDASISRILANTKMELMKSKELREECI